MKRASKSPRTSSARQRASSLQRMVRPLRRRERLCLAIGILDDAARGHHPRPGSARRANWFLPCAKLTGCERHLLAALLAGEKNFRAVERTATSASLIDELLGWVEVIVIHKRVKRPNDPSSAMPPKGGAE